MLKLPPILKIDRKGGRTTNRGISTAKAAKTTVGPSVETKEGKNMNVEAIAHGLVLLVVNV